MDHRYPDGCAAMRTGHASGLAEHHHRATLENLGGAGTHRRSDGDLVVGRQHHLTVVHPVVVGEDDLDVVGAAVEPDHERLVVDLLSPPFGLRAGVMFRVMI